MKYFKNKQDYIGQRFGKLVPIEIQDDPPGKFGVKIKCICDCGNIKVTNERYLVKRNVKSCGCLERDFKIYLR